jgi:hypothetical protein
MTTSLYAPVASPGDVSAKNYTSLYSDSLTPGPNPSGDVTIQGNLTVRGGNIYTTATTASVFPTNATTVNAFTAATSLNLGGPTGFTSINNELAVNGQFITLRANSTGTPPPAPTGEGGMIIHRGSTGQDAYIIWAETGTLATSYWDISADAQIQGDLITHGLSFVDGNQIIGNASQTSPVNDFYLIARRGLPTYPDVSLKWNESIQKWQFSNNGVTFYDMVTGGSGGSATFGNITIAVADANTITTTSGALKLDSATGSVDVTGTLTAANITTTGTIISDGVLGTNGNYIAINYDDTTLTANAGLLVKRGAPADVALRWNYTSNTWQFSNNGTTYYDMVSSIDTLTDVVITTPTAGQLLTYDGTNWVNNYTITGSAANQTINHVRSGAFNADVSTTLRNAARFTKKFTDVTGAPTDRGGPGLLFNVQDSASTNYAYATITSNYSGTGNHSVSVLTSTDNFSTNSEAINITATQTSFPGSINVTGNINAASSTAFLSAINLDSRVIKNTATQTYTSASQQVFGNVPIATYRTVKYVWQISRGTEFQAVETLVTHDGTTAHMVAYGDVRTGNNLADFNVDISGSNMRILVTPTSAASTTFTCDYSLFYI